MVWKIASRRAPVALALAVLATACAARSARTERPRRVPLFEGLGSHQHPITTGAPRAQRYFDQGLILAWGFNHAEAARSFRAASRIDPECAMCYWGEALVLGPNINAPMDPDDVPRAWAALRKAVALKDLVSPRERAYIEALEKRYAPEPVEDRAPLDRAYARAMGDVVRMYPDDEDAATLYAEAIMDTHPWNYWKPDGAPQPWTLEIVSVLEQVIARNPQHPGANHLYIHAVEASPHPERAMASADRLPDLVPGIGHLVHMPSHIYIRTGRYHDAAQANERAIAVDRAYVARYRPQGIYRLAYVPHNHHFLFSAAMMEGRSERALAAARSTADLVDRSKMREPRWGTLQHYLVLPLYGLVRFGKWDTILDTPAPPRDLIYPRGVWHYARGMALAAQGRPGEAQAELERLRALAQEPALDQITIWGINQTRDLLEIAVQMLAGEIAAARDDFRAAIEHLEQGVRLEDALSYDEPRPWPNPMRQALGAVLLQAGRPARAERVFQEDLLRFPENGWSLYGLALSLEAQGKEIAAQVARRRFELAWSRADVAPSLSLL